MKTENNKALYYVAAKVFLVNDAGNFLITKDVFGDWDIPGGRLKEGEFDLSFEDLIERKVQEELGEQFTYKLNPTPVLHMRHQREEVLGNGERAERQIFALGFEAAVENDSIELGDNHETYRWVNPQTYNPADDFTGGWLEGVEQYCRMKQ